MKKFFHNKFFIAFIFLCLGFFLANWIKDLEFLQSINKKYQIWVSAFKTDVKDRQEKIFKFNGKKFVQEIKENVGDAFVKTSKALENAEKNISKKILKSKTQETKQLEKNQEQLVKSTEVRSYEDAKTFSFELILTGYRYEDVIISISENTLNFSSLINSKKMIISNNDYSNNSDSRTFYYSFTLQKYDRNLDPEINYKDNIVSIKFFKTAN